MLTICHGSKFTKTPRALAQEAGAKLLQLPLHFSAIHEDTKDLFFFTYPELPPSHFRINADWVTKYLFARNFYVLNKCSQREYLIDRGIRVPATFRHADAVPAGMPIIARPLRHTQAVDCIYMRGPIDKDFPRRDRLYYSQLMPPHKEFRTIFVRGEPLITMYKAGGDRLWSYTRIDRLPLVHELAELRLIKSASIVGADIAIPINGSPPVCYELNLCPALGPHNLATVASYLRSHPEK